MNSLVFIVIGILFLGGLIGYIKVFAKKITLLMLALFSLYIAYQYAPVVNAAITKHVDLSKVESGLTKMIDSYLDAKVEGRYIYENGEMLSDTNPEMIQQIKEETFVFDPQVEAKVNIIRNLELPDNITDLLTEKTAKYGKTYIEADSFAEYMSKYIVGRALVVVSFLSVLMGLNIIYRAFDGAKNRFKDGMVGGYLNRVSGAVLGAFGAAIIIWTLFAIVKGVPDQSSVAGIVKQIDASKLLCFVQDNNIVSSAVGCVMDNVHNVVDMFKPENLNKLFQMPQFLIK